MTARRVLRSLPIALLLAVAACADSSGIPDPVIQPGYSALDGAYVTDVKPSDAKFTRCQYALLDTRHVVRCGVSYEGNELAQLGYWEIVPDSNGFAVYAMNGKALAALDKITRPGSTSNTAYPGSFRSGQGRTPLDITGAAQVFK